MVKQTIYQKTTPCLASGGRIHYIIGNLGIVIYITLDGYGWHISHDTYFDCRFSFSWRSW